MKTSSIVLALAAAASAAVLPRDDGVKAFKLVPGSNAPADIADLGAVDWDGVSGGYLGFFKGKTEFTSFIQYNAKEGIAFYEKDTANELYVAPSGSTPAWVAKVGNPEQEASPDSTESTNWTVNGDAAPYYLGYGPLYESAWSVCTPVNGTGTATLYYGADVTPRSGCSEAFNLVVEYL